MTHVFHRHTAHVPPAAVGGSGAYIIDASGKRYLDASGGAAVSCLGHSDAAVKSAIHAQVDALAYAHSGFFTSEAAESLADRLISLAPEGIGHVYFTCGGSEAVEAALKMARQYFVEKGETRRSPVHSAATKLPWQYPRRAGHRG